MPATGPGTFDSHEAVAFANELTSDRSLASLDAAITGVLDTSRAGARLDLETAAKGLVSAEIVAAARGAANPSLPAGLATWVADGIPVTDQHRDLSLEVIGAVTSDDSELCESAPAVWPTWTDELASLRARLSS